MSKDATTAEAEYLSLYEGSADSLFRHCYFRVSDRDLARDLTQEAFTRTWEYIAKGNKVDNMKAFLFRTAGNLIIDHYRRKKESSLDSMAEGGFDPSGDDHKHIPELAAGKEALRAVKLLEEDYRQVIVLRFINDLTIGEIAEIRGESENAVSVRIHRALKKLKEILEHGRA